LIPDFKAEALRTHERLGAHGAHRLLDAGRAWDLAPVLEAGGAIVFPHAGIEVCGAHAAAAVHACMDVGRERVLVLGVLHALTDELEDARARVAAGGDVTVEPAWGIQGTSAGRQDWRREFSLDGFLFLWRMEAERRSAPLPTLVTRYPYLAGGRPEILPGIEELAATAADAAVVATADPFHHGIGYGDRRADALDPAGGGLDLARRRIEEGLEILRTGSYWDYHQHCVAAKSDARDVGQVLRYLRGALRGRVLDLVADDTSPAYGAPEPTWVAGALIELRPDREAGRFSVAAHGRSRDKEAT